MEIPPWIINPFNETEVANLLQKELLEFSTNEELKVKFKKAYQIASRNLKKKKILNCFSVTTNLLTKKEQIEHHIMRRFKVTPYKTEAVNSASTH